MLAVTNARILDGSGNRDTGPKRPTLKHRKDGSDDQTSPDSTTNTETPKDRPVLKRRDSDGKPPDAEKKP